MDVGWWELGSGEKKSGGGGGGLLCVQVGKTEGCSGNLFCCVVDRW